MFLFYYLPIQYLFSGSRFLDSLGQTNLIVSALEPILGFHLELLK